MHAIELNNHIILFTFIDINQVNIETGVLQIRTTSIVSD